MNQIEALQKELELGRKEIKTDSYPMSIGEIISMYKDNELKLDPAFQRLFRWDDDQKTRFIESILLGIPIPSLFVSQKEDGKWVIVDGVQRISTILQFVGVLEEADELILCAAKKLPSLENLSWGGLGPDLQRIIKRSKLGFNIILTENSIDAQYELFQRLNTGGSNLAPQEIRNCLIIMLKPDFYDRINSEKEDSNFKECLSLRENKYDIEHHMELLLRYLIAKRDKVNYSHYVISSTLLRDFIDNETKYLIEDDSFDLNEEIILFQKLFQYLKNTLGKDVFRKYNTDKKTFEGQFLESSFEAIMPGLAANFEKVKDKEEDEFKELIAAIYKEKDYLEGVKRGKKVVDRIKCLTKFSYEYFAKA